MVKQISRCNTKAVDGKNLNFLSFVVLVLKNDVSSFDLLQGRGHYCDVSDLKDLGVYKNLKTLETVQAYYSSV